MLYVNKSAVSLEKSRQGSSLGILQDLEATCMINLHALLNNFLFQRYEEFDHVSKV